MKRGENVSSCAVKRVKFSILPFIFFFHFFVAYFFLYLNKQTKIKNNNDNNEEASPALRKQKQNVFITQQMY